MKPRVRLDSGRWVAGEVYNRATLVHDGRAYDWLTCPACDRRFGSERARWEK